MFNSASHILMKLFHTRFTLRKCTLQNKIHEESESVNFLSRKINSMISEKVNRGFFCQNPATAEENNTEDCLLSSVINAALFRRLSEESQCTKTRDFKRAPSEVHFTVVHTALAEAEDGHTHTVSPTLAMPQLHHGALYTDAEHVRHVLVVDFHHARLSLFTIPALQNNLSPLLGILLSFSWHILWRSVSISATEYYTGFVYLVRLSLGF